MSDGEKMASKPFRLGHYAMRTEFTIFISSDDIEYAENAASAAFSELDRVEEKLSRFISYSDIAQANALQLGESFAPSSEAWECLVIASRVAAETGRAFDPVAGALIDFWKKTPTEFIAEAGASDAWKNAWERHRQGQLSLDEEYQTVTCVAEGGKLDLGAIGKGFALDAMAKMLEDEWGLSRALLSAGGSTVLALDAPENKTGWRIGFGGESGLPPVTLHRQALSSSGTRAQATHLVDPRTGLLVTRNDLVRAVAKTGAVADALSTAFFVMTRDEVTAYCADHPGEQALFATGDDGAQVFDIIGTAPEGMVWAENQK